MRLSNIKKVLNIISTVEATGWDIVLDSADYNPEGDAEKDLELKPGDHNSGSANCGIKSAAFRRASMELTRALARARQEP